MRKKSNLPLTVVLVSTVLGAATLAVLPADAADTALKDLMKKLGAQVSAGDTKNLAPIFVQTKSMGKSEFPNWAAISDKGKSAADKGDLDGAKATCKECHDAYRSAYKTKFGSKAP